MKYVFNALHREQGLSPLSDEAEENPGESAVYEIPLEHTRTDAPSIVATISRVARKADMSKVSPEVVCANDANSLNDITAREQYRTLRTKLMDSALPNGYKSIVVSSAAPGDGKSLTVLNLALAFTGVERMRVLVIEADLHRPSLSALLGMSSVDNTPPYYTDVPDAWQSSLVSLADNVDCLLAPQQYLKSTEFLESVAMQEILAQARSKYDLILVDSPPMLATADALILIRSCDAALFVVSAGTTEIKAARQAMELMAGKLLGCVLNRISKIDSGNYYKAYYQKLG